MYVELSSRIGEQLNIRPVALRTGPVGHKALATWRCRVLVTKQETITIPSSLISRRIENLEQLRKTGFAGNRRLLDSSARVTTAIGEACFQDIQQ
jgi:hypothetical protein